MAALSLLFLIADINTISYCSYIKLILFLSFSTLVSANVAEKHIV